MKRGRRMFDTNKVAINIKNTRTKINMTQMNLADEMGVSYQAVSNWERGVSQT
ncbi:MAG: helix-turn-helix transcriptional regulator [Lachnospiraceae bacterium]|nr:helix-turn-helix transcriptional regulator [Lachnospiraceae bacterium]